MKTTIVKTATLIVFFSLIAGFVLYRSGFFGGEKSTYQISPNGGALSNQNDSIKKEDSIVKWKLMPSSKSMPIHEPDLSTNEDKQKAGKDSSDKIVTFIPSSKSAIIFKPKDVEKKANDSIKK